MQKYIVRLIFMVMSVASVVKASTGAITLGTSSPSNGLIGLEYYFLDSQLSTNIHLGCYEENYMCIGASVAYHPLKLSGPYVFHTSQWLSGSGTKNGVNLSDNNYWKLIFGLGWQHLFFSHFGVYAEIGLDSYAGNGGYYIDFDSDTGKLSNNSVNFPIGLGVVVPF